MNFYSDNGNFYFTANDGTGPKLFEIPDTTAPSVSQATWNYATKPQSMQIRFNEDVSAALTSSDFQLINTAAGLPATGVTWNYTYDPSTFTATLTFTAPPGGVLPDGNYQLQLGANSITDLAGNPNAAYTYNFFSLTADANRDGIVNALDFNALASHYGKTGQTLATGDFNFDGRVNSSDFALLAARYGENLHPPSPALTAAHSLTTQFTSLFSNNIIDPNRVAASLLA
jgi:hypothetical protein